MMMAYRPDHLTVRWLSDKGIGIEQRGGEVWKFKWSERGALADITVGLDFVPTPKQMSYNALS